MQSIIVEKPYRFVPPHRGNFVPSMIHRLGLVEAYLKRSEGIHSYELRNIDLLKNSINAGHGILLAPNHCRYADPIAVGWISRAVGVHLYSMASWHLFNQNWLLSFAIRMCGGFSIYREGLDRTSLDTAIQALVDAERPLVVFPEGTVFRSNDHIQPLLDGATFLARSAARRRKKSSSPGKSNTVVIHPIAIKYTFGGDLRQSLLPVIEKLESRFCLATMRAKIASNPLLDLRDRLHRLSLTLLGLLETKHLGSPQTEFSETIRRQRLIERILSKHEDVCEVHVAEERTVVPRIKNLRTHLVPELLSQATRPVRKNQIWNALEDLYQVQQISGYQEYYLQQPTETRLLETAERIEEDVEDRCTIHRPLHAILEVCPAIEVPASRAPRNAPDPVTESVSHSLTSHLQALSAESPSIEEQ